MAATFTEEMLDFLVSPAGRDAVKQAEQLDPNRPSDVAKLRKVCAAAEARAVLELVELRGRGKQKFSRADRMYFDRVGYEQSSDEVSAGYKARRMERNASSGPVLDLCCGIGGDTIALAAGQEVWAVEGSRLRVRMTDLNLRAYERRKSARLVCGNVRDIKLIGGAFHLDPDRRARGKRGLRLEDLEPGVDFVNELLAAIPSGVIKLSPAVEYKELPWPGELEMISVAGECKQLLVWTGVFVESRLRATVLPEGASLTEEGEGRYEVSPVGRYVYDPDPAVTRLRLLPQLAGKCELDFLAPGQIVLTCDERISTPFATCYEVEEVSPFHQAKLHKHLQDRAVGAVAIKPRGLKVDVDELSQALSGRSGPPRVVFLLRLERKVVAVVARRVKGTAG